MSKSVKAVLKDANLSTAKVEEYVEKLYTTHSWDGRRRTQTFHSRSDLDMHTLEISTKHLKKIGVGPSDDVILIITRFDSGQVLSVPRLRAPDELIAPEVREYLLAESKEG